MQSGGPGSAGENLAIRRRAEAPDDGDDGGIDRGAGAALVSWARTAPACAHMRIHPGVWAKIARAESCAYGRTIEREERRVEQKVRPCEHQNG